MGWDIAGGWDIAAAEDITLPAVGSYAAGMAFLPVDAGEAAAARQKIEGLAAEEGLTVQRAADPVRSLSGRPAQDCYFVGLNQSVK